MSTEDVERTGPLSTATTDATSRNGTVFLHAVAFLSGLAALVYEVVWTRRLVFLFGATIRAVSAVLAAYMAGLALGSLLGGRRASRVKEPLVAYGLLEGFIGVAGLLVPVVLGRLRLVDAWLYGLFGGAAAFGALTTLRFVLAFVVVGVPAALMGATFPMLIRATQSAGVSDESRVATIYGANTAGAVVGTFLSGFYLLGAIGLTGTERFAAGVNFSVALAAIAWWKLRAKHSPARDSSATSNANHDNDNNNNNNTSPSQDSWWIVASVFVVGFASLACEVLWSRALSFTFSGISTTTYAFAAMLGVFLAGIALGSALFALTVRRLAHPQRRYGALVVLAGVAVSVSALTMISHGSAPFGPPIDELGNLRFSRALLNLCAEAAAVVGLPAMLFGAAFPAAVRAVSGSNNNTAPRVSRLYAASTAGAIVGSVLGAFVIVPRFGVTYGVLCVGALLLITGAILLARTREALSSRAVSVGFALVVLVSLATVSVKLPRHPRLTTDDAPVIFYEEGATATVAVLQSHDGFRRIDVDGMPVAGTSPTMLTDQKSLAHYPMALVEHPRSALTVGFGSGGTSHSLLLYPELRSVHAIEIAPEMLHGAPYLTASNHGVLTRGDPRYRVILDDARSYLSHTTQHYDIIATDCTDLRYRSNANLYDREYFQHCRARLTPGGVLAVWLPLGGLSPEMFRIALRTVGEVFNSFVVFWPNGYPSHYVILVGWRDRRHVRWDTFVQRLSSPAVRADLAEISLADPVRVLSTLVTDGDSLRAALQDAPINTEDHPVLEFLAPLYGYSPRAPLDNLHFLLDHPPPVQSVLDAPVPQEPASRLAHMHGALPKLALAHAASFANDRILAARFYLEALALAPEDEAMRARVRESRTDLTERINAPWRRLLLCRAEQLLGSAEIARRWYLALPRDMDQEQRGAMQSWSAAE